MKFAIEKGVPLPPRRTGAGSGRPAVYPWREMEVGDSFAVPFGDRSARKALVSMTRSASDARRRIGGGVRFSCRTEGDCVRIWRVA